MVLFWPPHKATRSPEKYLIMPEICKTRTTRPMPVKIPMNRRLLKPYALKRRTFYHRTALMRLFGNTTVCRRLWSGTVWAEALHGNSQFLKRLSMRSTYAIKPLKERIPLLISVWSWMALFLFRMRPPVSFPVFGRMIPKKSWKMNKAMIIRLAFRRSMRGKPLLSGIPKDIMATNRIVFCWQKASISWHWSATMNAWQLKVFFYMVRRKPGHTRRYMRSI